MSVPPQQKRKTVTDQEKVFGGIRSAINILLRAQALEHQIESERIDTILARLGVVRVDLLKLDIQGGELAAIEGARRTIEASPKLILLRPGSCWQTPNSGLAPSARVICRVWL